MRGQVNFATAVQLMEAGRNDDALQMGRTLLKSQKKSEMLLRFCGACALNLGELKEAAKYYSKLIKFHPRNAGYWSDLGYIYFTSKDFKRAKHAYSQAARHEPGNPDHVLGEAVCRVGEDDLEGAAGNYLKALHLAPAHPSALQGLANVRRQQSRPFEAIVHLRHLAQISADKDAAFWVEYAEVSFSITSIPETIQAIEKALELGFNDTDLDARIALVYSKIGHVDEAVSAIRRAIDKAPDDTEILNDAAAIYTDAGDNKAAVEIYRKIIAKRPELAKIYFSLSQLRKFSPDTTADTAFVAEMEKALERDPTDPALLHFALAKAYSDMKQVDRAFHHLTIGNKLRRQERPYSLKADVDRAKQLQQKFPAGCVDARLSPVPDTMLSPIFIVGMPRSGTTLVEQIIAAHPKVTACGELQLLSDILSSRSDNEEAGLTPQTWTEIGDLYRAQVSGLAQTKSRITDKMPHNFFNVGAIWSAMPDARVILLQRNPLDTGLSCYQTCFSAGLDFTYDLATIGGFYRLCAELCGHWKQIAPERLLVVQYEDLVSDIDVNIRRILDFCDLEWHRDCERYFEKHRRIGTASFNQANKPVYRSSVEKWRAYEAHLKPLIEALQ